MGHLDVGSGLDVTGNITCGIYIEGAIKDGYSDKIEWVNTNTYIWVRIQVYDADDNFKVFDTDAKFSSS